MKKTWAVIAMLAAFCTACSNDDDNEGQEVAQCQEGERVCSSNGGYAVCANGEFVQKSCGTGEVCSEGFCIDQQCANKNFMPFCDTEMVSASSSVSGVRYCMGGHLKFTACNSNQKCMSDGPAGAYCMTTGALVKPECSEGAVRCNAMGQLQACTNSNGNFVWGAPSNCPAGMVCSSTKGCVKQASCTDGAVKCADQNTLQECKDGDWVTTQNCQGNFVCSTIKKTCVDKTAIPEIGEACDDNFVPLCTNQKYYYCSGGSVKGMDCLREKEMTCINNPLNLKDECAYDLSAEECSKAGDTVLFSADSGCSYWLDYGVMFTLECVSVNGAFYGVESISQSICSVDNNQEVTVVCSNQSGQWDYVVGETCSGACSMTEETDKEYAKAVCQGGSQPKPGIGDACTASSFSAYCQDSSTAVVCQNSIITASACGSDKRCSGGACVDKGQDTIPTEGSACTGNEDLVSICDGNDLYYCNASGKKWEKISCTSYDQVCKSVSSGRQRDNCVHPNVDKYCSNEGDMVPFSNSCEAYSTDGYMYAMRCQKIDNAWYGVEVMASSICASNNGQTIVAGCTNGTSSAIVKETCSSSCKNGDLVNPAVDGVFGAASCVNGSDPNPNPNPNVPAVGDSCNAQTFDWICDGEGESSRLLYCGSDGKVTAMQCQPSKGYSCLRLNDGTQDCVMDDSDNWCTAEGDLLDMWDDACSSWTSYGVVGFVECQKVGGKYYLVESYAASACMTDEQGSFILSCSSDTEKKYEDCASSCKNMPQTSNAFGYGVCI